MKYLLKISSYLFHPLWMPFLGTLFYFLFIPRFFPPEVIKAKLIAISIITVFIPIVFYFLLKNLGKAEDIFLKTHHERKWPLLFFALLCVMVLTEVLNFYNYPGLYYYFAGILISVIIALIFVFFRMKISLHMMGISGLLIFVSGFCYYFHLNFIYTICFLIIATGLTATSRLYYKAHSPAEVLMGFLTGLLPQLGVFMVWFYRM